MSSFLKHILLFVGVFIISTLPIYFLTSLDERHFIASIKKKDDLLQNTQQPRIIISGGSNAIFGINSKLIQKRTGKNTVNMSLHAALPFAFMINQLKENIIENDTIILIPEYTHYGSPNKINEYALRIIALYPKSVMYFPLKDRFLLFIKAYFYRVQKNLNNLMIKNRIIPKRVSIDYVNEFGDFVGHLNLPKKKVKKQVVRNFRIDKEFVYYIKDMQTIVESKGGKMFLCFPSLAEHSFNPSINDRILERLDNLDIPYLGEPIDFVFHDSLFYDTRYHLHKSGRQLRTKKIIDLLK